MAIEPQVNQFGQPIGEEVESWVAPAPVQSAALTRQLEGQYCSLIQLQPEHAQALASVFDSAPASLWTYLPYGPFNSVAEFDNWIAILTKDERSHTFPYAICSPEGEVLGVSAYLRMQPEAGSIEIGHLTFAPALQQTRAASEALYLMIEAAFLLGYRRVEWKCNSHNDPSVRAAKRLGFMYEGTFRQALVVKGRNRDTDWFSIIDSEWDALNVCFQQWLNPDNFDAKGKQKIALSSLTAKVRNSITDK